MVGAWTMVSAMCRVGVSHSVVQAAKPRSVIRYDMDVGMI